MTGTQDNSAAREKQLGGFAAAFAILFFAAALACSLRIPVWLNSDEPFHFIYISTILNERRMPTHQETYQAAHPPAYFLAAAAWDLPFRNKSKSAQDHWVRVLSALMGAVTIYLLFLIGKNGLGSAALGAAMAAFAALSPAFLVMNSVVNNDPAAILACTAAIYLILKLTREKAGFRAAALCGAAAGACCLVKINANFLPVFFVVFYFFHPANSGKPRVRVVAEIAVFCAVFLAVATPWYIAGYLRIGNKILFNPVTALKPNPLYVPANLFWFLKTHALNFWLPNDYLRGNPMGLPTAIKIAYLSLSAVCAALAVAGIVAAVGLKDKLRRHILLSFGFCTLIYLAQQASLNMQMPVAQARYAFIMIAPMAALVMSPFTKLKPASFEKIVYASAATALLLQAVWLLIFLAGLTPPPFNF